jgi:hypothetical protein
MVDGFVLRDRQVKLVVDQALRNVRLQLDVSANWRQITQASAFVSHLELLTDTEFEGGVHVEDKVVPWSL